MNHSPRSSMSAAKYDYLISQAKKAAQNITREVNRPGKSWREWMVLLRAVCLNPKTVTEIQKSVDRWEQDSTVIDYDPVTKKMIKMANPTPFDEERLKSMVMSEMNKTLSSGKLTRIAALDVSFQEKPMNYKWFKWPEVLRDIFKGQDKNPTHGAIVGPEGAGKTYFAVWLAENLREWTIYSNIRMWRTQHGSTRSIDYHHVTSLKELFERDHERSIFILDESGIHWSSADYATKRNKIMGKLLRICRKRRIIFILIDQLYRTLPKDLLERNPLIFDLKKHQVTIISPTVTTRIEKVTKKYMDYDSMELPTFTFDLDLDKYMESI